MPSDEMVEKACAAYWECYRDAWRPYGIMQPKHDVPFSELHHSTQDNIKSAMRAALAAAEAGEPVAEDYVLPCDVRVAPGTLIRKGCKLSTLVECIRHREGKPDEVTRLTSPPSEASRDERAAIRKEAFEEAARIAEDFTGWQDDSSYSAGARHYGGDVATAIRARGET